jgi:cytochrome d ubiquinol oxidase subunit I
MDSVLLSRIQFAANISFHILFPAITIALCWVLLFFRLRYLTTKSEHWMQAYRFWVRIFALSFAMGVVSGVTMSFQFGTNWPGFMNHVGNIAGPLLAYEVLTAFFLEATFLGIMLFGEGRVPPWVSTVATILVAVGTTLSAYWILALNSWMQTPAGFKMVDGVAYPTDWLKILWTPSLPYRLVHMLFASGLTVSFLIAGLSAYRWLRGDRAPSVKAALKTGVIIAAILAPLQILAGDQHGLNTLEYQPQKIAAMEANWKTRAHVPLVLFGFPNENARKNFDEITIPDGASLILRHRVDGVVPGLDEFGTNHPPVKPVFYAFRLMVGIGLLMLAVAWYGAYRFWRKRDPSNWYARVLVGMTFAGWVATLAGWYTTEIGRQPWLVEGVLKTAAAVTPVPTPMIGFSFVVYILLYITLITAYVSVLFYLARNAGPSGTAPSEAPQSGVGSAAAAHGAPATAPKGASS